MAAENPVYVQGNFNAQANHTRADSERRHRHRRRRGDDAVEQLERHPIVQQPDHSQRPQALLARPATAVAIVSGKGLPFPRPAAGNPAQDFGTDGGAHNFLRYVENWTDAGGVQQPLNYRGSIVSFYLAARRWAPTSCSLRRSADRGYNFDNDFLAPRCCRRARRCSAT